MKTTNAAAVVIAKVFSALAVAGDSLETAAAGILRQVKVSKVKTEEQFAALALAAFDLNGWHVKQGKPKAGSDRRAVPATVRTYVWEVRAALREGLPVWKYRTFYDLRMARKALKAPIGERSAPPPNGNGHTAEFPADVAQDLQGVRVAAPEKLTGALFHDLVATFLGLGTEQRLMFGRQLTRLMHTYQRKVAAPAAVPLLAAPRSIGRKAASG